jgi:hypothetical protein
MPIAEDVAVQLKSLLQALFLKAIADQDERIDAAKSGAKGSSSSTSSKQQDPRREEKLQATFEKRFRALKRIPGGFSTFDDSSSDPGCHWEVEELQHRYDPVHYGPQFPLQVSIMPSSDEEHRVQSAVGLCMCLGTRQTHMAWPQAPQHTPFTLQHLPVWYVVSHRICTIQILQNETIHEHTR